MTCGTCYKNGKFSLTTTGSVASTQNDQNQINPMADTNRYLGGWQSIQKFCVGGGGRNTNRIIMSVAAINPKGEAFKPTRP